MICNAVVEIVIRLSFSIVDSFMHSCTGELPGSKLLVQASTKGLTGSLIFYDYVPGISIHIKGILIVAKFPASGHDSMICTLYIYICRIQPVVGETS